MAEGDGVWVETKLSGADDVVQGGSLYIPRDLLLLSVDLDLGHGELSTESARVGPETRTAMS